MIRTSSLKTFHLDVASRKKMTDDDCFFNDVKIGRDMRNIFNVTKRYLAHREIRHDAEELNLVPITKR